MERDLETLNAELWKARALALEDIIVGYADRLAALERDRGNLRGQLHELRHMFERSIREGHARSIHDVSVLEFERQKARLFDKGLFAENTVNIMLDEIGAMPGNHSKRIVHFGDIIT